jgi:hypothetical protein
MFARAAAIVEVVFVFALAHVTYRSAKHFTIIGQWEAKAGTNFTPGMVMILITRRQQKLHGGPRSEDLNRSPRQAMASRDPDGKRRKRRLRSEWRRRSKSCGKTG